MKQATITNIFAAIIFAGIVAASVYASTHTVTPKTLAPRPGPTPVAAFLLQNGTPTLQGSAPDLQPAK